MPCGEDCSGLRTWDLVAEVWKANVYKQRTSALLRTFDPINKNFILYTSHFTPDPRRVGKWQLRHVWCNRATFQHMVVMSMVPWLCTYLFTVALRMQQLYGSSCGCIDLWTSCEGAEVGYTCFPNKSFNINAWYTGGDTYLKLWTVSVGNTFCRYRKLRVWRAVVRAVAKFEFHKVVEFLD